MSLVPWWCLFLHVLGCHSHIYKHGSAWNGYEFHTYPHPAKRPGVPRDTMVDVTNNLGLKLLAIHNEYNENNIAISPYGALSVLIALGEGLEGDAVYEIQQAANIPHDISIIRVGLRDVHRHLKSYFIPKEGFLAGLTLNHENVTLRPEYEDILKFYGYDTIAFNSALYPEPDTTEKPQSTYAQVTTTEDVPTVLTTEIAKIETNYESTTEILARATTEVEATTAKLTTATDAIQTTTLAPETSTTEQSTVALLTTQEISTTTSLPPTTTATMEARTETTTKIPTTTELSTVSSTIISTTTEMPTTSERITTTIMSTTQLSTTEEITEETTTQSARSTRSIPTTTIMSTTEPLTTSVVTEESTTSSTSVTESDSTELTTTTLLESTTTTTPETTTQSIATTISLLSDTDVDTTTSTFTVPFTSTANNNEDASTTPVTTVEDTSTSASTTTSGSDTTTENNGVSEDSSSTMTTINDESTENLINKDNEIGDASADVEGFGGAPTRSTRSGQTNIVELNMKEATGYKRNNKRRSRSVLDYLIARYYDDHYDAPHLNHRPYIPKEQLSFLVNEKYREYDINFMKYDTVLPFHYVPHLNALALSFPLDSTKYYLLLLLPADETGIDKLVCDLRLNGSLRYIIANLRYTHVVATIPSFMLKGYVTLTPSFQKLGIRKVFEPRQADFSPMTNQRGIYVTNIEQAITVTIRNYVDPNTVEHYRNLRRYDPVHFKADHPFLYFVIDSEIHVTLMAGKIVNPLNSRIS